MLEEEQELLRQVGISEKEMNELTGLSQYYAKVMWVLFVKAGVKPAQMMQMARETLNVSDTWVASAHKQAEESGASKHPEFNMDLSLFHSMVLNAYLLAKVYGCPCPACRQGEKDAATRVKARQMVTAWAAAGTDFGLGVQTLTRMLGLTDEDVKAVYVSLKNHTPENIVVGLLQREELNSEIGGKLKELGSKPLPKKE